MTSLEKAINLGYLFLTFKPKNNKLNIPIHATESGACIDMFYLGGGGLRKKIVTLN